MAYVTGFVDNSGGASAHYVMLALIRHVAGGLGTVGTIGGTRTGNGTLSAVEASATAVTETWTLTCTATAIDGGTFSVVGSVSGNIGNATVGTPFSHTKITFLISDGAVDFANADTFTIPVTESATPVATRWEVLRYDTSTDNHELILKGEGLSGTEEIFVGFKTYQSAGADYYNISCATFTAYIPSSTFETQPGVNINSVPAHHIRIDYWLIVNAQRIACAMKVGTPVYESFYVGKFLPYTLPSQYPYPVACCGTLNGSPGTRYSDTAHAMGFSGNTPTFEIRRPDGTYASPHCWPWTAPMLASTQQVRETGTVYTLQPIVLHNNSDTVYGELDGVFHISGFSQAVENTLSIGGVNYVVMQNTYRTGFNDYFALRLS